MSERHASFGQSFDIWRSVKAGRAEQCRVTPAKIVRENEHDVRLRWRGLKRLTDRDRKICGDGERSPEWLKRYVFEIGWEGHCFSRGSAFRSRLHGSAEYDTPILRLTSDWNVRRGNARDSSTVCDV